MPEMTWLDATAQADLVRRGEVSPKELADARRYIIGSYVFEFETDGQLAAYLLEVEHYSGRLTELLLVRKLYAQRIREVKNTSWKALPSPPGAAKAIRCEGAVEQA